MDCIPSGPGTRNRWELIFSMLDLTYINPDVQPFVCDCLDFMQGQSLCYGASSILSSPLKDGSYPPRAETLLRNAWERIVSSTARMF